LEICKISIVLPTKLIPTWTGNRGPSTLSVSNVQNFSRSFAGLVSGGAGWLPDHSGCAAFKKDDYTDLIK